MLTCLSYQPCLLFTTSAERRRTSTATGGRRSSSPHMMPKCRRVCRPCARRVLLAEMGQGSLHPCMHPCMSLHSSPCACARRMFCRALLLSTDHCCVMQCSRRHCLQIPSHTPWTALLQVLSPVSAPGPGGPGAGFMKAPVIAEASLAQGGAAFSGSPRAVAVAAGTLDPAPKELVRSMNKQVLLRVRPGI